jgi:hypothetical protein
VDTRPTTSETTAQSPADIRVKWHEIALFSILGIAGNVLARGARGLPLAPAILIPGHRVSRSTCRARAGRRKVVQELKITWSTLASDARPLDAPFR